jgi:hypothetical protein
MENSKRLKELKKYNHYTLALQALEFEQKAFKLEKKASSLEVKLKDLEVAQLAFQVELSEAIEEIEKQKFWKKLFGYRKLVNQLIRTIKKGFKK